MSKSLIGNNTDGVDDTGAGGGATRGNADPFVSIVAAHNAILLSRLIRIVRIQRHTDKRSYFIEI
jgi:hypothetical protein